jgi:hypothetical protein
VVAVSLKKKVCDRKACKVGGKKKWFRKWWVVNFLGTLIPAILA